LNLLYIRQISLRRDEVYICSRSSNEGQFRQWKNDTLTQAYQDEGQRGLDRELVRMFCEYAVMVGCHHSLARYRPCVRQGKEMQAQMTEAIRQEYVKLTPQDIASLRHSDTPTDAARAYQRFEVDARESFYRRLAQIAAQLPEKPPRGGREAR